MPISPDEPVTEPSRCVIVVDATLPVGRAANAAAVVALTLGKRHPDLAGPDLIDASGKPHPGLIPIGIALLAADASALVALSEAASRAGLDVVDFPRQGQETTDYARLRTQVAAAPTGSLEYVAVGLLGPRKAVGRLVGKFPLLR